MTETKKRLERAASGLVVIIVGVLVALWADAAWQSRNDVRREQSLLRDLQEEFFENRERIQLDMARSQESQVAGARWADAMLGRVAVAHDSLPTLWLEAQNWGRFDPVTGALRSVIDGGELSLIRNDELREALAGWPDLAEEARMTSGDVLTVLAGQAPVALAITPGGPHTPGELAAIEVVRAYSQGSLVQLPPLLERLDTIVQLIEAELAR